MLKRIHFVTADSPEVQAIFDSEQWQNKTPLELSFQLFGVLRFDPDLQQEILENRSMLGRLTTLLELLN